jgi:hypothetical protein
MENALRGVLCYKGERGYSAYEIAVKNGFIGTEKDWLALLGASTHFARNKYVYTATEGQTSFDLPDTYTSESFIDVYINGFTLNKNEFSIDTTNKKINLVNLVLNKNAVVEIVVLTMSTTELPIVTAINGASTDNTVPSAKATYEAIEAVEDSVSSKIAVVEDSISSKFAVVEGTIPSIAAGQKDNVTVDYPSGFTGGNCVLIGKQSQSDDYWYDCTDLTSTGKTFPVVTDVELGTHLDVTMKNLGSSTKTGIFKLILMKV